MKTRCLNCKQVKIIHIRGICWTCARDPEIRNKFPKKNTKKHQKKYGKKANNGESTENMTLEELDAFIAKRRKTMIGEPGYPETPELTIPFIKVKQ